MNKKYYLLYRKWTKSASYIPGNYEYVEQVVEIAEHEDGVNMIDPHSTPGFVRVSYTDLSFALIPFGQVLRITRK